MDASIVSLTGQGMVEFKGRSLGFKGQEVEKFEKIERCGDLGCLDGGWV